ncbi:MAG TPA: hypothetical protein VKQ72_23395, partial [Aggregatilineales bacterium]|nr:hypothetical protein [Aggregatilineales bacterium]
LFFLNKDDAVGLDTVKRLFPAGMIMPIKAYDPTRDFIIYVAPPPGCDWAKQNLGITPAACLDARLVPGVQTPDATPVPNGAGITQ